MTLKLTWCLPYVFEAVVPGLPSLAATVVYLQTAVMEITPTKCKLIAIECCIEFVAW